MLGIAKDVQALMLRVTASLERADAVMAEAQILMRQTTEVVSKVNRMLDGMRQTDPELPKRSML